MYIYRYIFTSLTVVIEGLFIREIYIHIYINIYVHRYIYTSLTVVIEELFMSEKYI
jgi:hypothetical protein